MQRPDYRLLKSAYNRKISVSLHIPRSAYYVGRNISFSLFILHKGLISYWGRIAASCRRGSLFRA
ncbi:MAG: hypothetical protein J6X44_04325, partial [Thermoguttaceae bacterium]|nr:hypothetical protein [Thermoguttaceae bacterium]